MRYNLALHEHRSEVLQISMQSMLDELQLNLYGNSLLRLVDFGQNCHIVESLAPYELLHNECISISMFVSSHLAYMKSRVSLTGLE